MGLCVYMRRRMTDWDEERVKWSQTEVTRTAAAGRERRIDGGQLGLKESHESSIRQGQNRNS